MGKAKKERDFKQEAILGLNAELEKTEAIKNKLEEEIETLTEELAQLNDELTKATVLRGEEKEENLDSIKKSKEGYEAVSEAIRILEEFYGGAAKAKVNFVQTSPVDEEAPESGFSGAYKGNQAKGGGIIAILKVLQADFDRTDRKTDEAEKAAHEDFVEFARATKVSIAEKETMLKQKKADLEQAKIKIAEDLEDLEKNQKLLDSALKELEELRPACVDTGMTYEERVAAREKEIEALKKALCILDTDNVEPECSGA